MSLPQAYQCLSCRLKTRANHAAIEIRRTFQSSAPSQIRKRNRAMRGQETDLAKSLKPYTEAEKKLLAIRYSPEQMKAIEAGEEVIDSEHMTLTGRFRSDKMRIEYIDDFATVRPMVDHVPKSLEDELHAPLTEGAQPVTDTMRSLHRQNSQKPQQQGTEEEDPHMLRLTQQTGLTKDQIRKIRIKNLVSHRVVNQTRMGKIQSLYFLTIAGNQDGMLGIGEGKAAEDEDGRRQAMMNAIRNMKPIPRYEDRTIYGESEGKVGASVVQLSARPPGFGNRCQHLIFELARAAGITDLAARTPRSRNKMNVVKAAFQALTNQRLPEDVARARGRKMVDVRSVYYGGSVH